MIEIGLTGWSDHDTIITSPKRNLVDYASHFPVVEMDTSFYAIPSERNIAKWLDATPNGFQFIPKAYGPMTTHARRPEETHPLGELFELYLKAFAPMIAAGKVKAFLFQFPPLFSCMRENVDYLRKVRKMMGDLPIAVEFRHKSWFVPERKDDTLQFMKEMRFINVVVDQPQTPDNSIPFVPVVTNSKQAFLRLHGRNYEGWLGDDAIDWRKFRTLYNYNEEELVFFKEVTEGLAAEAQDVTVIFNNNSGGHAAPNAKALQEMLGLEFGGLAPRQLDLFE